MNLLTDIHVSPRFKEDIKKAELMERMIQRQYKIDKTKIENFVKERLLESILNPDKPYVWK